MIKRLIKISDKTDSLNDLWRGQKESEDFVFLICLIIPILVTILLGSTLYNGWRHLYFIYPIIILFSLRGLYFIKFNFFKKNIINFYLILSLLILNITYTTIKYHPHQNNYFNILARNETHKNFDMDYWGLGNKQAIEKY